MPRKATKAKKTASRKNSIASVADDASQVSSMAGDIADLASLDDFDEKENNLSVSKKSAAPKSTLQARKVLAKEHLLKAFDAEVESRCKQLRLEAESLATGLKQSMAVWKVQLPARVRTMKLSEFVNKYGGNINAIFDTENVTKMEQLTTPLPRRSERITKQSSRVTASESGAQVRSDLKTPQTATKTTTRSTASSSENSLPSKQLFTNENASNAAPVEATDLEAMMRKMISDTMASTTTKTSAAAGKRGQNKQALEAEKQKLEMLKGMLAEYEKKLADL